MSVGATFLGGAKSRLLPPSIPFRFFSAAAVFHVFMWLGLLIAAEEAVSFRGGLGPALSAVHLLALGFWLQPQSEHPCSFCLLPPGARCTRSGR
jgi:hypothetical protein